MRKVFEGNVLVMAALVATDVGDVVVFEDSVGIAQTAGAVGEDISVDTRGVYEFPATTSNSIKVGDVLYWNASTGRVTTTVGTNKRVGVSWSAKAANVEGLVDVKIG